MEVVVVDTDVVSYTFKRDPRSRLYRPHLVGRRLGISFMTLAELLLWPRVNRWGRDRWERLYRHLESYGVRDSDEILCERWAAVMAQTQAKGRPIEESDAWIAATALDLEVPLVTNNPDDYAAVDGLVVLTAATARVKIGLCFAYLSSLRPLRSLRFLLVPK